MTKSVIICTRPIRQGQIKSKCGCWTSVFCKKSCGCF